jgi:hypothetical protein
MATLQECFVGNDREPLLNGLPERATLPSQKNPLGRRGLNVSREGGFSGLASIAPVVGRKNPP